MTSQLLFLNLGGPEIFLIVLVVLLLFGGKKIPELMRGLGKGVKSFKEGMNDVEKSINDDISSSSSNSVKKTNDTSSSGVSDSKSVGTKEN